jgi:cytidylate kinase
LKTTANLVITISRELGSGGAYIGRELAQRLDLYYADREIISMAAEELQVVKEELESRDERLTSFWDSIFQSHVYPVEAMGGYTPSFPKSPTDVELFEVEAEVIRKLAQQRPAVIVGRGASYILRAHPRHVSIFLHASRSFRQQRIQELYQLSAPVAQKLLEKTDRDRSEYFRALAGKDWADARRFHLALDTGVIGVERAIGLIDDYIKSRFEE